MKILFAIAVGMLTVSMAGALPAEQSGPAWSPFLVGALIGLLSMATFYFSDKPIGVSTGFARVAGMIGKLVAPRHTSSLKYYDETKPKVDWEVMLIVGILIGSFFAAWTGQEISGRWIPAMWAERFGDSLAMRLTVVFIGGLLIAFGARLAGGCTSGHGISGTLQLSVGSWIAVICFFLGGVATAMLLYRV